jgi:hypothetical protein
MDSIGVPKSDEGWPYTYDKKCLPTKQEITILQDRAHPAAAFLVPVLRATSQTHQSFHSRLAIVAGVMSRPQYRI